MVGFCELAALVIALAGWAHERGGAPQTGSDNPGAPAAPHADSTQASSASVQVSNSQGVQIGNLNTQKNYFTPPE
jgi:hypothetical protein